MLSFGIVALSACESLSVTGSPYSSVNPEISAILVNFSPGTAVDFTLTFICTST